MNSAVWNRRQMIKLALAVAFAGTSACVATTEDTDSESDVSKQTGCVITSQSQLLRMKKAGDWRIIAPQGGTLVEHAQSALCRVELNHADLSNTDLSGLNLLGAQLQYAVLKGANLTNTILRGADLRFAVLDGATLDEADLSSKARLAAARLDRASLVNTNLANAIGPYASFKEANLTAADFSDSWFPGAKFDGADVMQTKFTNCNLGSPSFLGAQNYVHAFFDGDTLIRCFDKVPVFPGDTVPEGTWHSSCQTKLRFSYRHPPAQ